MKKLMKKLMDNYDSTAMKNEVRFYGTMTSDAGYLLTDGSKVVLLDSNCKEIDSINTGSKQTKLLNEIIKYIA